MAKIQFVWKVHSDLSTKSSLPVPKVASCNSVEHFSQFKALVAFNLRIVIFKCDFRNQSWYHISLAAAAAAACIILAYKQNILFTIGGKICP